MYMVNFVLPLDGKLSYKTATSMIKSISRYYLPCECVEILHNKDVTKTGHGDFS